jgi:hypothetical protein
VLGLVDPPSTCPSATTGPTGNLMLLGPMTANGATVSNLEALTNGTLTGSDTATVTVINNTTGATVLSCTINSTNKSSCQNAASATVPAGDYLEVKVTTSGNSGANKEWQVTFRF